jgi:hypothetical protein
MSNPWAPKNWEDFESDSLEASFSQSQPIAPGIVVDSAPHTVFDADSDEPQPDSEPFVPAPITTPVASQPPTEVITPEPLNASPSAFAPVAAAPVTEIQPVGLPIVSEPVSDHIVADSQSQSLGSSFSGSLSNIVDAEDRDRTVISKTASVRWALISSAGTSVSFPAGRVIVGRKPAQLPDYAGASLVEVADPTRTVSKNHALLEFIDGMWWISDLDSTNGVALVRLDGSESRVTVGQRAALTEKCYLGDLLLTLHVSGA